MKKKLNEPKMSSSSSNSWLQPFVLCYYSLFSSKTWHPNTLILMIDKRCKLIWYLKSLDAYWFLRHLICNQKHSLFYIRLDNLQRREGPTKPLVLFLFSLCKCCFIQIDFFSFVVNNDHQVWLQMWAKVEAFLNHAFF